MKKILVFALTCLCSFNNLAQEIALVRDNKLWGYISKKGEWIVSPTYKGAKNFSPEGLAAVLIDKKWGYIDHKGELIIEPQFDKAGQFNGNRALVAIKKDLFYIDATGKRFHPPKADKYYGFEGNIAPIKIGKQVGFINRNMEIIINPEYEIVRPFVNQHARVKKNGLWGMLDAEGRVFISPRFNEIGNNRSGIVKVRLEDKFYLINEGKEYLVEGAEKVWDFESDARFTTARQEKRVGYIDTKGQWIIKPQFYVARPFVKGMAPVYNGKRWGYINEKGEYVIEPQFNDAESFGENGLAPVKPGSGKWAFIDSSGKMVSPAQYQITAGFTFHNSRTKGFINNRARVKYNDKWGFIDRDGKPLLGWFQNVKLFVKIQ